MLSDQKIMVTPPLSPLFPYENILTSYNHPL